VEWRGVRVAPHPRFARAVPPALSLLRISSGGHILKRHWPRWRAVAHCPQHRRSDGERGQCRVLPRASRAGWEAHRQIRGDRPPRELVLGHAQHLTRREVEVAVKAADGEACTGSPLQGRAEPYCHAPVPRLWHPNAHPTKSVNFGLGGGVYDNGSANQPVAELLWDTHCLSR